MNLNDKQKMYNEICTILKKDEHASKEIINLDMCEKYKISNQLANYYFNKAHKQLSRPGPAFEKAGAEIKLEEPETTHNTDEEKQKIIDMIKSEKANNETQKDEVKNESVCKETNLSENDILYIVENIATALTSKEIKYTQQEKNILTSLSEDIKSYIPRSNLLFFSFLAVFTLNKFDFKIFDIFKSKTSQEKNKAAFKEIKKNIIDSELNENEYIKKFELDEKK